MWRRRGGGGGGGGGAQALEAQKREWEAVQRLRELEQVGSPRRARARAEGGFILCGEGEGVLDAKA